MHTYETDGWVVHHNGDFSGDAHICEMKEGAVETVVPIRVLLGFVAKAVRNAHISAIEETEDHDVLGLPESIFKE